MIKTMVSMQLPISVFIIAQNEADRIAITINSVKGWVDEVIVVDSGSSDETVRIAESLGAKTFFNAWPGYGMQKRFGEDQCRNHWLLNLDADEEITPALAEEIKALFAAGEPPLAGYILKVRDLLLGEKALAPLAHTNYCLRLYNRAYGRFSDSPVHDSVILERGETRLLNAPMLHRSFRSLAHAVEKINSYSTAQARNMRSKPLKYPYVRLVVEFPFAFFKSYILRCYCLRGWRGFAYAMTYAYGRLVRIAKYIEIQNS